MSDPAPSRPTDAPVRASDRIGLQPWLLVSLAVASATCLGVAGQAALSRRAVPSGLGLLVGAALGVLAVLGLPSISVRLVARLSVVLSAGALLRFGTLSGSLLAGTQGVLAWVVAAVAVFVLSDRAGTDGQRALGPPAATEVGRSEAWPTARALVLAALAVVVFAVLLTPIALPLVGSSSQAGDGPKLDRSDESARSLRSTDELDMTGRPDLTDEVMFTVESDRATFWRGETFDRWDGRRWTRSQPSRYDVSFTGLVTAFPDDLGARGTEEFTQTIRIETSYADVVFAAPSAVRVDSTARLAQRDDGTLTTEGRAFGSGATYQVTSRRPVLTEERLRAVDGGTTPDDITTRYAQPPATTDRVVAAATRVTAGATTTYDKVLALERWMGARTEYSLDAPLSPKGVDVVDHFLFTSRQGWCEQIASSLVVLARANGIPARLATGFVPDERDPVTGRYIVRANAAHAWAEVWFPELGWVPFDPTADVPLAGTDQTSQTWIEWLADHAVVLALGAAVVVVAVGSAALLARRARRRPARPRRSAPWPVRADARLVALGTRLARPRRADETATAYAAALAERCGEPRLALVGVAIDDALFAPDPLPSGRQAEVDAVLAEAEAAEAAPDAEPEPVPTG